jgi:sporulation protein YqfC
MDVLMRLPARPLTGDALVEVENHRGILEYSDRRIRIDSVAGPLTVRGDHMMIATIQRERIVIRGCIYGVHFGAEGE